VNGQTLTLTGATEDGPKSKPAQELRVLIRRYRCKWPVQRRATSLRKMKSTDSAALRLGSFVFLSCPISDPAWLISFSQLYPILPATSIVTEHQEEAPDESGRPEWLPKMTAMERLVAGGSHGYYASKVMKLNGE